ncbi:hypothetical protein [Agrobacterium albertimagni]|uniref:hypothetical protein n=1 Tax=Agrobacterium albertimagni TaxID=147266 RepID=UPI0012FDA704|nr:hypothetical protein [Agrobacterium albertimagni]
MSQNTSMLARPEGDSEISRRAIAYASESARQELYDLVVRNCVESGVTKATLAKRLNKDPAQVSRLLGAPGNWTIDTVAELLFAIDGSLLKAGSFVAAEEAVANMRGASCFVERPEHVNVTYVNRKELVRKATRSAVSRVNWR